MFKAFQEILKLRQYIYINNIAIDLCSLISILNVNATSVNIFLTSYLFLYTFPTLTHALCPSQSSYDSPCLPPPILHLFPIPLFSHPTPLRVHVFTLRLTRVKCSLPTATTASDFTEHKLRLFLESYHVYNRGYWRHLCPRTSCLLKKATIGKFTMFTALAMY